MKKHDEESQHTGDEEGPAFDIGEMLGLID